MTSRDERQEICRINWIKNKCHSSIEACTGFGKTRVALNCIKTILDKYPNKKVLIVVPTIALKEQWFKSIDRWGFSFNCNVQVINSVVKEKYKCDFLILDEIHRFVADSFKKVFENVEYSIILGLTATIERLDGKHELINKYCPVLDKITLLEAQINGWVSNFIEYQVLLNVDTEEYDKYTKEFNKSFDFFGYDFSKAMKMVGPDGYKHRLHLCKELCPMGTPEEASFVLKNITYNSMNFMRAIQQRKAFINNHPKKIEITKKIIEARPDSKIITFSNSIKMAESIGIGYVYSGKDSKKKGRMTMDEFREIDSGVLNSSQKCNEGLDIPNLSVAIMLGIDSSKIKAIQRVGRVIRLDKEDKKAEIFNLIINNTVETSWFKKAHPDGNYITIDEEGLDAVLKGEIPNEYKKKIKDYHFRY